LDDWVYQDLQVAKFFGVSLGEIAEWYNADFYDYYEFMMVQNEYDRRALRKADSER